MYKYTWCIYNVRTLTPACLRRTKIGFTFLLKSGATFPGRCDQMDPQLSRFWVHVVPLSFSVTPSFRYDQTEKPLWTCKRYLTSRRAFVFTRSEKSVLHNNKNSLFLLLQRETYYYSTFAWHAATQTQTSNAFEVRCLQFYLHISRTRTNRTARSVRFQMSSVHHFDIGTAKPREGHLSFEFAASNL